MAGNRDSSISRDLLRRFTSGGGGNRFPVKPKEEAHGPPENVELNLGLSLNGRFGIEPQKIVANDANINRKLFRASSVNFSVDVELSLNSPLTRTCSLPPETEAEWRKRKELQSLRRLEAKRKRVEKLKNVRVVKTKTVDDWEPNRRNLVKQSPPSPSPSPSTSPPPTMQFSSQGSIGSQGSGGSSGVSDLESQPFQGTNTRSENLERTKSAKVDRSPGIKTAGVPWPDVQTMPCVSTKVEGPDGKKIQGFLYRYGKSEEVRIVCVCHGSFLTPSEFVKHGGGDDVEHPLRHIVVTPSLFS